MPTPIEEIKAFFETLGVATENQRARFQNLRDLHHGPIGRQDAGMPIRRYTMPITEAADAKLGEHTERAKNARKST